MKNLLYELTVLVVLIISCSEYCIAGVIPDMVPMPHTYQAKEGMFDIDEKPIFIPPGNRQCQIAAEEIVKQIITSGGKAGSVSTSIDTGKPGVFVLTCEDQSAAVLMKRYAMNVTPTDPGSQGYAIAVSKDQIVIVGSDSVGALYGAMTLRQMIQGGEQGAYVNAAVVRDKPDYFYRGGLSVKRGLARIALNAKDRADAIKTGLDWLMHHKLNMVMDYEYYDPRVVPEKLKTFYRDINTYAVERGIYPMCNWTSQVYGWWTSKTHGILPPGIKTKKDWPCVYDGRVYRDSYHCWSADEQAQEAAVAMADYFKECQFKILYFHNIDGGSLDDPEFWSKRCERCRSRWKDGERWKASVHQAKIWHDAIKAKNPDMLFVNVVYPYSASYLRIKTPENQALWQQNVIDYWSNIHREMDPSIMFLSWLGTRDVLDEYRNILHGRNIHFQDRHERDIGLFSTFSRFAITDHKPDQKDLLELTGYNSIYGKWMFYWNFAEFAWNTKSPGHEVWPVGTLHYDFMRDHTEPNVIMEQWLPKACRLFWGEDLAEEMTAFYTSGLYPNYLMNPGATLSLQNRYRIDPLADTDPLSKKRISTGERPAVVIDSIQMMQEQFKIANRCLGALDRGFEAGMKLDPRKRVIFAGYYRRVAFWKAIAQARYQMRLGDQSMVDGSVKQATQIYQQAMSDYQANMAIAREHMQQVQKISDPFYGFREEKFKESNIAVELKEKIQRKLQSAQVVLAPRRPGAYLKVAIYQGPGAQGTLKFFDHFANVKAQIIDNLGLATLDQFDCLFMMRSDKIDRFDFFNYIRDYVVKGGGSVVFEHTLLGNKRFESRTPFPEICKMSVNRHELFDRDVTFNTSSPLFPSLDGKLIQKSMYVDFFEPVLGEDAFVIATNKDAVPICVGGQVGSGKVIFDGSISLASQNNTYNYEEKELFGFNATLAQKAVEWFTGVKLEEK